VVDTQNDSDLDLHKNLEGIVRQSEPYTCGPAALATLLSQLGDDTTEHDVLNFAPANKDTGVSLLALKQATVQLGHSVVLKKWTAEQLSEYLKQSEDPILIHDIKQDVGGHFSVVRDIKDGTVSLSDTEAGNITYSFSDFSKVFTGYTLIADPDTSNPTSSSNLLLLDTTTNITDEEATTITGKYVPVAIAAASNGASAAASTFSQCMKTASFQPTTALRRTKQSQCYSALGAALSQVSVSTEATIAYHCNNSTLIL
jgi:predicted double-glycine peptidase